MTICTNENVPSEQEFLLFQSLVHSRLGISLPKHKRVMLGHRLFKRVKALNLSSFGEYYRHINLLENGQEMERALELITTNETFFFREEKHFDFLKDEILSQVSLNKVFKVWSAAASSGEEPYSIAMILQKHCIAPWQLKASDVNNSVLEHARKGIYIDDRAKFLPAEYRTAYCMKGTDEYEGYLRVKPELRKKVVFFNFNLLDSMADMEHVDLIFLRNVMIYFDDDTRQKIVNNLQKTLKPGGWLFISHSETLHGLSHNFELIKPAIYKLNSKSE